MVRTPKTDSQVQRSSGRIVAQRGGRPSAVALHRLRRLALCMSVIGVSLLSAAGVAVSQNASPSLQAPDTRMQAPIGHRQPRPSDLPPDVRRDERLDPQPVQTQPQKQAAQTQPQKQTANRRTQAGTVPTIDARKGCEASQEALGSIFGPNNAFGVDSCLRQEQEARQQIINKWTTYPTVDKQKCVTRRATTPAMSSGSPAWRCTGTLECSATRRRASVLELDNLITIVVRRSRPNVTLATILPRADEVIE